MLDHEKLDVYQRSIEFLSLSVRVLNTIPRGNAIISEQLKRASLSIPLNIAEGCGKISLVDKRRFYVIARGSAMECGAVFDACKALKIIKPKDFSQGKELLVRIVSILTKMSEF